jgi:hypothetical protein
MQIHELTQQKTQLDEALPKWMDPAAQKAAAKQAYGKLSNTVGGAAKKVAGSRAGQAVKQTVGQAANQATQYANTQYNKGVAQGGQGVGGAIKGAANVAGGVAGKTVGGIKGLGSAIASPFKQTANAYNQAKINSNTASLAGKAQTAWTNYVENLQNTQSVTPDVLKTNLRAFVQKNLLGNLAYQYDSLTNVDVIEDMIASIADPRNADPTKQTQLWKQLVKTISVAQAGGRGAGGRGAGGGGAGGGGLAPVMNPAAVAQAVQKSGISPQIYQNMASVVQGAAGNKQVNSTGNPGLDAFLKSLGFSLT